MKTIHSSHCLIPRALFATALALTTATLVHAQASYISPPVASTSTLVSADSKFLNKAAAANSEEVAIARVALSRTTNNEVRNFAQELVTAHEKVDTDISQLATTKVVGLEAIDAAEISQKWSDKKGSDFDKDFVKEMVSAHKKAVSLFEKAAKDAKDTDVAAFARDHLATLNSHLREAEDLAKLLK